VSSHGDWTGGECTGDGTRYEFLGEFGGTTKAGCEEESKFDNGPGENLSEFPRRSNHSNGQAQGEEIGGRPLWL
jgi:hypothetical protein